MVAVTKHNKTEGGVEGGTGYSKGLLLYPTRCLAEHSRRGGYVQWGRVVMEVKPKKMVELRVA